MALYNLALEEAFIDGVEWSILTWHLTFIHVKNTVYEIFEVVVVYAMC